MNKRLARKEEIKQFIIQNLRDNPAEIVSKTSAAFSLRRETVLNHLRTLRKAGLVQAGGSSQRRRYELRPILQTSFDLEISPNIEEDRVWRQRLLPSVFELPGNVLEICQYGFCEVLNNAVEHSGGKRIRTALNYWPDRVQILVMDDGAGIFNRLSALPGIEDRRHAVLELAKGKLTTAPERHLGSGLFMIAHLFDWFSISSYDLRLDYHSGQLDFSDHGVRSVKGTGVVMQISTASGHTIVEMLKQFDVFPGAEGVDRTVVPVFLGRAEGESLVTRSQARRLLARCEQFKEIIFDFSHVEMIGANFADEIFRVFAEEHPGINLAAIHANPNIRHFLVKNA